jgi:hypothetical protein
MRRRRFCMFMLLNLVSKRCNPALRVSHWSFADPGEADDAFRDDLARRSEIHCAG